MHRNVSLPWRRFYAIRRGTFYPMLEQIIQVGFNSTTTRWRRPFPGQLHTGWWNSYGDDFQIRKWGAGGGSGRCAHSSWPGQGLGGCYRVWKKFSKVFFINIGIWRCCKWQKFRGHQNYSEQNLLKHNPAKEWRRFRTNFQKVPFKHLWTQMRPGEAPFSLLRSTKSSMHEHLNPGEVFSQCACAEQSSHVLWHSSKS